MKDLDRRLVLKLLGTTSGAIALAGGRLAADDARAAQADASTAADTKTTPTGTPITERIADYIVDARFEDLPRQVVQKVKEQIVYFFGGAFEVTFLEQGQQMLEVARHIARSNDGATVIGQRLRLAPSDAAFANGSLFGGELAKDDTLGEIHPGVITLPAALAIGEIKRASGRELILAMVQGYEVLAKLNVLATAWYARPPRRATNIYGGFGPVTAAGRLLKLDRERMANALGYAAHLCMGLPEGSMMQHYYGLVARNGTFAAQLAQAGGKPFSKYTIEGDLGLYRSFFGKVPETLAKSIDSLGYSEILAATQKRLPGTGANTTAIELFAETIEKNRLTPANVPRVEIVIKKKGSPLRAAEVSHRGPFESARQASQSLPYWIARVLLDGKIDSARFWDESIINNADVKRLMERIEITFEPDHDEKWARVTVHTSDGRKLGRESELFIYAFPPEKWGSWLAASGQRLLSTQELARLEELIRNLEDVDDVSQLLAAAVPAARAPNG
jgi:2-methylcitrate dehydratase PrpD